MMISINSMEMLALSIVVLTSGMVINRKISLLERNHIPPAVTGGIAFSIVAAGIRALLDVEFEFDMQLRDLLLIMFFTTIGLKTDVRKLLGGGKALVILVLLAGLLLISQNLIGLLFAGLFDREAAYGLMAGSVSLSGGHGTAAAWGAAAENAGYGNASMVGLVFATFGLVAGGLFGGPVAKFLVERNALMPDTADSNTSAQGSGSDVMRRFVLDEEPLYPVFRVLCVIAICVSLGATVHHLLSDTGLLLPGFLTAMLVAIVLANVLIFFRRPLSERTVQSFGGVSLQIFLTMSMMDLKLWLLAGSVIVVLVVLLAQIALMVLFVTFIVFRIMGKDYDAAVICAGFFGLGLGATPVAIANMEAVGRHYGASQKAMLVIPLVGAFFIDLMNAGVISVFVGYFIQ